MKKSILKSTKHIFALALSALIAFQPIGLSAAVFFRQTQREVVAGGIVYENRLQATNAGLISVSALFVDIHNPHVELRAIAPENYGTRASTRALVLESGAMAGINADFFDMGINPTSPFGDVVVDGRIVSVDANRPYNSTFFIGEQGRAFIEYINPELIFLNNGERNMQVQAMNKFLRDFSAVYFDRSAITNTAELDARFPNLWKYVVQNGVITYIGTSTVDVPENGFIIVAAARYAYYFTESVRVGHTASFSVEANFDFNTIQQAIGGASMILLDGELTSCGFVPSPYARHPRSALGISQDDQRVILAVVDGRGISVGATHAEMAQIMRELGAYQAMHFDGGGSSTLVADTHFSDGATLRNRPSEGTQRAVVNALGVFHTAEVGEATSLLAQATAERVFLGDSVALNVIGVDANLRVAEINPENITFTASADGRWEGNAFFPAAHGNVRLYATYGEISTYVNINTLNLAQIVPTPMEIRTNAGAAVNIALRGIATGGSSAPLGGASFEVHPTGLGTVVDGVFTATAGGASAGFIRVIADGVRTYIPVSVGTSTEWVTGFDNRAIPLRWSGSPASVSGSVAYDSSVNNPGNYALRLNYQFAVSTTTQAAYLHLEEPVGLGSNLYAFEIAVYGHGRGGWLRGLVRDAAGETHIVDVTENVDFLGWRNHTVRVPAAAVQPLQLEQFYIVNLTNDDTSERSLFFDDLRAVRAISHGDVAVPVGNRFQNPFEAMLGIERPAGQIDLKFIGDTTISDEEASNEYAEALQRAIVARATQNTNATFFVGPVDIENVSGSRFGGEYSFREYGNYAIIEMSARNGTLSNTQASNWAFFNAARASQANNIIIMLDRAPSNFSITAEYELFHSALTQLRVAGKNVFVVSASGMDSASTLIDGINYINLGALFDASGEQSVEFRTLRIRLDGANARFELQ